VRFLSVAGDIQGNNIGDGKAALREIAKDRPSLTLELP
jgi:hypothetical protein